MMGTISERLRGCGPLQGADNVKRTCREAADVIDALVEALEKARHWCPTELREGQIDAALALASKAT